MTEKRLMWEGANGVANRVILVDLDGNPVASAGAGGGSGTSDTTEATQLLVKAAVESINTKTPALSGGKVPVTDPTTLPLPAGAAVEATQLLVKDAVVSVADRTPALVGGAVPVTDTQVLAALSAPLEVEVLDAPGAVTYAAGEDVSLPAEWDLTGVAPGAVVHVEQTAGQRVIALTVDPTTPNQASWMRRVAGVRSPASVRTALSVNQRARQDSVALAVFDPTTVLPAASTYAISSLQQAAAVLTITLTAPFAGQIGDVVSISGVADNRLCYQDAPISFISEDRTVLQITHQSGAAIPILAVGPVTGGVLTQEHDPIARSSNGAALCLGSATSTLGEMRVRRGGQTKLSTGVSVAAQDRRTAIANSAISRLAGGAGALLVPTSEYRLDISPGGVEFLDRGADAPGAFSSRGYVVSDAPAATRDMTIAVGASRSVAAASIAAQIVSITRVANVVTVTLDRTAAAAGIVVGQYPQVAGVLSTGLFPNTLVFASAVNAVSGNTFTIPWTGTDGTSYGGIVSVPVGGIGLTGLANNITAVAVESSGRLVLTAAAAWAGVATLDVVSVSARNGTTGADLGVTGLWSVLRVNGVTLTLVPLFDHAGTRRSPTPATLASTTAGGVVVLATTVRVHSLTAASREDVTVQIAGQGTASLPQSVPAYVTGGSLGAFQGSPLSATGGTLGWPVSPGIQQVADLASGAITTTTTSGPFALAGNSGGTTAFMVVVNVTAVSGTSPTMDCSIEVQDDGARWYKLYDMPRITAAGQYSTPELRTDGRSYRIVQTLGGTSPSFTRSIVRNSLPFQQARHICQAIDRTVSLTTLGAATPALYVDGAADLHLVVNIGAATTPPALQLQVSEDNGATWASVGSPVTAVASGTVKTKVPGEYPRHARAVVTTAGAGVTAGYVLLKAVG